MIHLEHHEAVFFRLLAGFFGEERVIPYMSLRAACGGELPISDEVLRKELQIEDVTSWVLSQKCLFTVVDKDDQPKLVFDFFSGFDQAFEVKDVTGQQYLRPILFAAGVQYITITDEEFAEILDPSGKLDFYHWLKDKVELE